MSSSTLLLSAKNAMRKELKKRLLAMSSEERAQQSRIIVEKLFKNKKYKESYRISVYLNRDIEVCTYAILEHLFQTEKICFIPKYDSSKPHMDMVRLFSMEDYVTLPSTKWNIKQPSDNSREEALSSALRKLEGWKPKCDTCRRIFNGPVTYKQHVQSTKHKKLREKERRYQSSECGEELAGISPPQDSSNLKSGDDVSEHVGPVYTLHKFVLCCEVCNKTFTGPVPYSQHMIGETHYKHLHTKQLLDETKLYGHAPSNCQEEAEELSAKLLELTLLEVESKNVVFPQSPSEYFAFCELCMKRFTGLPPFQRHILSNGHKKRLMQKKVYDAVSEFLKTKDKTEETSCEMRHHYSVAENLAYYGTCSKNSRSELKNGIRFMRAQQSGNSSFRLSNSLDFLAHGRRRGFYSRSMDNWHNGAAQPSFKVPLSPQRRDLNSDPDSLLENEKHDSSTLPDNLFRDVKTSESPPSLLNDCGSEDTEKETGRSAEGKTFTNTCEVCQKTCTGPVPLQWHLAGSGHQRKLKNKEFIERFVSKLSTRNSEEISQQV